MLTVIFATFNGERTLPTVLDAYKRLEAPSGGWKLVVIDNGSTDRTPAILQAYASSLPMTRMLVSRRGKNVALNAGLEAREGDLVVLTDDDAVPASNWLREWRFVADEQRDFAIFGGAVVARWERQPDPWILDWVPHSMTYTITNVDLREGAIPATLVAGPNMAVRAKLFDLGHQFNDSIGPLAGTSYPMGSETEFTLRMEQNGHRAYFAPNAVVEHMIRSFQMEKSWVLSRAVRYGRCLYRRDRQKGTPLPAMLLGMPRWQLRRVFLNAASALLSTLSGNEEKAFRASWEMHFDWGYVSEARSNSRTGKT